MKYNKYINGKKVKDEYFKNSNAEITNMAIVKMVAELIAKQNEENKD